MENDFPDDSLRRGGPYENGAQCAANCAVNAVCSSSANVFGPFSGNLYQSPVLAAPPGSPYNRFSSATFRVGPYVDNAFIYIGAYFSSEAAAAFESSPTRWAIWATGEEDGQGNVTRYRELVADSGWVFGQPKADCIPPFPTSASQSAAVVQGSFEAIDHPRCFEVVVQSPCNLTHWYYQFVARTF
jgi:hypothetical protein